jgi:hypothetical protein
MSTIINATTTNGVVIQPDNSGSLQLQTNSGTTAVTIDTSQKVLVNTSTARANFFNTTSSPIVQVEGTSLNTSSLSASRNSNDTSSPWLVLAKSRGTTVGSNTIVQNGDSPGQISFQGNDGTEFVEAARITCTIDGAPGANDMPGRLAFATTADGAASPTEQMSIDSAGLLKFNSGYGSVETAYGCRAWVNFNGTGTVAIRSSGNVTSITDHAVGKYTINFTTAMPDANYSVAGSALHTDGTGFAMTVSLTSLATPVAGSCRISVAVPTVGFADPSVVDVAVFR